jgi:hypothetical protein
LTGIVAAIEVDDLDASPSGKIIFLTRVESGAPFTIRPSSYGFVRVVVNPLRGDAPTIGSCVAFDVTLYNPARPDITDVVRSTAARPCD